MISVGILFDLISLLKLLLATFQMDAKIKEYLYDETRIPWTCKKLKKQFCMYIAARQYCKKCIMLYGDAVSYFFRA